MDKPTPTASPVAKTITLLLAVAVVGLAVVYFARRGAGPEEGGGTPPTEARGPEFLNAKADVAYTGTQACVACHEEEGRSYQQTSHSRSLRTVDVAAEPVPATYEHATSGLHYRIYDHDGRMRMEETLPLDDGDSATFADRALTYVVGSGTGLRSYLCEDHGFLFIAPLSWSASDEAWSISPGFDRPVHPGFSQPVGVACLSCHAGRVEPLDGTVNRYQWHEEAIGCERCHGAGELHGALQGKSEPGTDGEDLTIANPARMSRQQQMDVCAQCHMDPTVTVVNAGKKFGDWRPGMPWNDVQVTYRMPHPVKHEGFSGHVDPLWVSKCYQGSDTLTCLTCHTPHERPPVAEAERKTWYNRKCLTCHEACKRVPDEGPGTVPPEGDDCTGCHMPRVEELGFHQSRTDHRIIVPGYIWTPPAGEDAPDLEAHGDLSHLPEAERNRNLGIAYLLFSGHTKFPQKTFEDFRDRAKALLVKSRDLGLGDAVASAASARVLLDERDRQRAIALAEAARGPEAKRLLRPDRRAELLAFLAANSTEEAQYDDAESLIAELLSIRRFAFDYLRHAELLVQAGKLEEAAAAAREAVAIWPNLADVQYRAARIFGVTGDDAERDRHNVLGSKLQMHVPPPK